MKSFFSRIWQCLTDPKSFSSLPKSGWAVVRYLYALLFVIALAGAIIFAIQFKLFIPSVHVFADELKSGLQVLYPEELVVTVDEGHVSTNVEEPYMINFPENWNAWIQEEFEGEIDSLMVIDTKAHVEDYIDYKTVVLLTEDTVVYPSEGRTRHVDGEPKTTIQKSFETLDEDLSAEIDRPLYDELLTVINSWIDRLPTLVKIAGVVMICIFPFIVAGIKLAFYLCYLLLAAAILKVIAIFLDRSLSYKELYVLSGFGITLPLLIKFVVTTIFGFSLPFFSFTAFFMVWMGGVLYYYSSPKKP